MGMIAESGGKPTENFCFFEKRCEESPPEAGFLLFQRLRTFLTLAFSSGVRAWEAVRTR